MSDLIDVELPVETVLERRLVHPVFLPVMRLDDGFLAGYEALSRIGKSPGGSPSAWLAAASRRGLRSEFELLCLEAVGMAGPPPGETTLFVNVSVETLFDERFSEIRDRLAADLVVDVEQSEIFAPDSRGLDRDLLRALGVRLAVVNTSTTSLLELARLRPDFVKLDRDIVSFIDRDPTRQALVKAVVGFAREVGIATLAEQVERREDLEVLRDAGVAYAQGHLFGAATPTWQVDTPTRRDPVGLDSELRQLRRLRSAPDVRSACDAALDVLAADGLSLTVFLERGGLLRCQAHRGYDEVLDGIPSGTSIMWRVMDSGHRAHISDLACDPGVLRRGVGQSASIEPLVAGGEAVGCLTVESNRPIESDELLRIHRTARVLGERLETFERTSDRSPLALLARATKELTGLPDRAEVQAAAVRVACDVARMSTAALVLPSRGTLELVAGKGPLVPTLRRLLPEHGEEIAERVSQASSVYSEPGVVGTDPGGLAALRAAGLQTTAAMPVRLIGGAGSGLLVVADADAGRFDTDRIEALELLADTVARALVLSGLVDELRDRAMRDPLTGLQNQRAFAEAMSSFGGRRVHHNVLMMADIDGFKKVNDTLGHRTGDRLLSELAVALDETLRPLDRLFRVGGDEFAAILPELDATTALHVAERLCAAAATVLDRYSASLSIGVAMPRNGESADALIERADQTLYEAKRSAPGSARLQHG